MVRYSSEKIIELDPTDVVSEVLEIQSIIVSGDGSTTAHVFKLGNASFSAALSDTVPEHQFMIHRKVNGVTYTSGPVGGKLYILLK